MPLTVDKLVHLSDEQARSLRSLAAAKGATEDALIAQALTILFNLNETDNVDTERKAWSMLSQDALDRVWDNDADAIYDNWKDLYGIS